jgi:hypothetical protein
MFWHVALTALTYTCAWMNRVAELLRSWGGQERMPGLQRQLPFGAALGSKLEWEV